MVRGAIQHQDVKEMLGLIDRTIIYDLVSAIHQNQKQRVSELLMQFRQQALDVSLVLDQLISTLHELALLQYLPDLSLKYSAEINKKIMQLSQLISAQDLQLYYQVACKGLRICNCGTQEQGFKCACYACSRSAHCNQMKFWYLHPPGSATSGTNCSSSTCTKCTTS